jgi:hypothetical protein
MLALLQGKGDAASSSADGDYPELAQRLFPAALKGLRKMPRPSSS